MSGGIALIIGMASVTIGAGITEKILNAAGKTDAAQYMSIAVIAGLATTTITAFFKFIQALKTLA